MSYPRIRSSALRLIRTSIDRLEPRRLLCWDAVEPLTSSYVPGLDFTNVTPLTDNPTIGRPWSQESDSGGSDGRRPEGAGADIVWVNRLFGDNFAASYGANEVLARSIVDRAIADWERVISDFNYSDGSVTFNLTLRAENTFPGVSQITSFDPAGIRPDAALVRVDDTGGGGQPWYFDPTPGTTTLPDDSDFADFVAAYSSDGGPGGLDFYQVVLHELGHSMGISGTARVLSFIPANTFVVDPNNPGDGILPPNAPGRPDPGNAVYPVNIGGGAVEYAMTNAGGSDYPHLGPAHLYEGAAVGGWPIHPNDLMLDGRSLTGNLNVRRLISDTDATFLSQVYGYGVNLPSQINTFHANFNTSNGNLRVNGNPASGSFVTIDVVGANIRVQVDGTSELIPTNLVNSLTIRTGDGNDTINLNEIPSGIANLQVLTNDGNDILNVGNGDIDSTILSRITWLNAGIGSDSLRIFDQSDTGADSYFISNDEVSKPGTAFGGIIYSFDLDSIVVTANDLANLITVESLLVNDSLTINGRDGNDTLRIGADFGLGEAIEGHVNAFGDAGSDLVIFDDATGAGADLYLINVGLYQQTDSELLAFQAERLELRANNQDNDIGVLATGATTLNLVGNNGDDDFVLAAGDVDAQITSNITVNGGLGVDRINLNDVSAVAGTTLLADSDATGDFVDLTSGNRVRGFGVNEFILTGSPLADTFTSIGIQTGVRMLGNAGNDSLNVQGHPTLIPRATIVSGDGADTLSVNADNAGGARAVFEANDSLARLEIGTGGNVRVGPGDFLLEVTASVNLLVSGFVLDLTDGSFVRRSASVSVPFYRDRIASGKELDYAGRSASD